MIGASCPFLRIAVRCSINWFGESCPPYWRRNMAVNDSTTVPMDMLSIAHASYTVVKSLANDFDARTATLLSNTGEFSPLDHCN